MNHRVFFFLAINIIILINQLHISNLIFKDKNFTFNFFFNGKRGYSPGHHN